MKDDVFRRDFSSLSVKDLLDARDAYHVHLSNLDNCIGTAIGLFRMRHDDIDAQSPDPAKREKYGKKKPRKFSNTVVRSWSWPSVLVFVDKWYKEGDLRRNYTQVIPQYLYLPDGRVVPTCVVYAPPDKSIPEPPDKFAFPSGLIGGGYSCYTDSQGMEKVGTLGAVVTRHGMTYALTNHHVTGSDNQDIYSLIKGEREKIGVSCDVYLAKKKFSDIYPGWPGEHCYVNVDAGLIRIEDVKQWTSQVFGIGEVGPLMDMHSSSITLDLIGAPVRAFGSVSGPSEGEIYGLFYRYRSVGGFDYVADLLIGPRTDRLEKKGTQRPDTFTPQLNTKTGDSGTVVFLDPPKNKESDAGTTGTFSQDSASQKDMSSKRRSKQAPEDDQRTGERKSARCLQPLAMQWGGQRLRNDNGKEPVQFALATFLSTIFRELDLELLNDMNIGYREYWGKCVHFKIGYMFQQLLSDPDLRALMNTNRERLGFPNSALEEGSNFSVGRGSFVPLADVPDYIWVSRSFVSPSDGPRRNEPLQHFADMDDSAADGGPSLFELCRNDLDTNIRASVWRDFYAAFDGQVYGPDKGVLPFRIRQIYEAMVDYLDNNQLMEFVAAAGVLAHYVADAAIPLHVSILHHGYGPRVRRDTDEYRAYKDTQQYRIHSLFEQRMFEVRAVELLSAIDNGLPQQSVQPTVSGGLAAIKRIFQLMDKTYSDLPPEDIIAADDPEQNPKPRSILLYDAVGDRAATCVVDGCVALAELVESAWQEGQGSLPGGADSLVPYTEEDLRNLYYRDDFLPAKTIDQFVDELGF